LLTDDWILMSQISIPYAQIRGGSSKGLYFRAEDLPQDEVHRDALLVSAMGKGSRQIDGLGGADPLTSKVAIISRSSRPGMDVDYLFAQVVVGKDVVDTSPNCGNILSGVGYFALETGLVKAKQGITKVNVYMVNSGNECELIVQTPNGKPEYSGDTKIDGVPGAAAAVICNYSDLAGSACGALFPTGNPKDLVDGIEVTCIDNGMPVAIIAAESFGVRGDETPEELNSNLELVQKIYNLRMKLGPLMNLGDVAQKAVPKMCLISKPTQAGVLSTRTFIPDKCHAAIGVLGAVSVASACILPDTVCESVAVVTPNNDQNSFRLSVEHPSGEFTVNLETEMSGNQLQIKKAGVIRTARLLAKGDLFISAD
jgi:4-oxalomesaconate tautomerase